MAERCPTCGRYRDPPTIDRCVEPAAAVAPLTITASYVAAQTGVTMATANNYLSTLAAVGRLRRVKQGAYSLPEVRS